MNKLIFLGTGAAKNTERQMTSLCFIAGGQSFLIDCGDGMGTVRNLLAAGVGLQTVQNIFITHRHADHVIGMPHFLFTALVQNPAAHLRVYGPADALSVVRLITFKTHDYVRHNQERVAFLPLKSKGAITIGDTCVVTALKHPKVEGVPTTFAYKVHLGGSIVVFSSDTGPKNNLDKLAKGADILIHECFDLAGSGNPLYGHSSAKDAGLTATRAGVKQLILTHLRNESEVPVEAIVSEARQYFSGKVLPAADLLEITL